ncbi:hypothetical protein JVT61DRAFT_6148 [Boletus reticuloceps]|uniref:Uncharacterized protein n=1 Tax=Boletus reticuloceps TaxID=495285 RepID=A0A8I2YLQ6_9AGAM|nr:hypothetical protein JVT61DRAFT_6148 [Boletus reticuloceps]
MVTTRKENATKRVAQPLLDLKHKRRTKAEIEADRQRLEEERQNAEEVRRVGNQCIASIQDRQALEDVKAKVAAKPRPQPQQVQPTSKGQPLIALDQNEDENPCNDPMEADVSAVTTTGA